MLDTDVRIAFGHGQFGGGVEKLRAVNGELWSCAEMLGIRRFSSNWARILLSTNYLAGGNPLVEFIWSQTSIEGFTVARKQIYTEHNILPIRVSLPKYDGNDATRCGVVMLDNPAVHLQLSAEFRG